MVQPNGVAEGVGVVTVLYKVNLHCVQCAREIQKRLQRTQGVQIVDVDIESSEIKVMGQINPKLLHEEVLRISKKKVEMVVLQPKVGETKVSTTTTLKVHLHCSKCENDLKARLLKLKDVYGVRSDLQAQALTVQGTMESHKLVEYIQKKVRKHAQILTLKVVEEKKEKEVKIVETKKTSEEVEAKKIEIKVNKETASASVPYVIHYVNYAPQWFSDENPNACYVM
ncbi:hypothetical protein C5167_048652 [Papaver somniferum]|uniref:HMA domain-containing protein n=1 Tax=Papaver somniferum TaxID=3469 RepID=A0A4Y7KLX7_PAPSO|nr:heavy metal-associated isoprenylated plant protein 4-like [Papaver somniferum]RZC73171.1 hypothetical protein C5167_048652 [Papaver somniferum]